MKLCLVNQRNVYHGEKKDEDGGKKYKSSSWRNTGGKKKGNTARPCFSLDVHS